MPYLIAAVIAAVAKGYCGKKVSSGAENFSDCLTVSILRIALCSIIGAAVIIFQKNINFTVDMTTALICVLSGLSMAVFVTSWLVAIRSNAYITVSSFMTASFIITIFFGIFLFKEQIGAKQIIGILFIVAAVIMLIKYNNEIKTKLTLKKLMVLLILLASQGMINVSQKM